MFNKFPVKRECNKFRISLNGINCLCTMCSGQPYHMGKKFYLKFFLLQSQQPSLTKTVGMDNTTLKEKYLLTIIWGKRNIQAKNRQNMNGHTQGVHWHKIICHKPAHFCMTHLCEETIRNNWQKEGKWEIESNLTVQAVTTKIFKAIS